MCSLRWIWFARDGTPWGAGSTEADALGDALSKVLAALRDNPEPHAVVDHVRDVLTLGDCAAIRIPTSAPGDCFLSRVLP